MHLLTFSALFFLKRLEELNSDLKIVEILKPQSLNWNLSIPCHGVIWVHRGANRRLGLPCKYCESSQWTRCGTTESRGKSSPDGGALGPRYFAGLGPALFTAARAETQNPLKRKKSFGKIKKGLFSVFGIESVWVFSLMFRKFSNLFWCTYVQPLKNRCKKIVLRGLLSNSCYEKTIFFPYV